MSRETIQWLNDNVMYGFAAHRTTTWNSSMSFTSTGKPWWMRDGYRFLYNEGIPMEDVLTHLFSWEPVEADVFIAVPCQFHEADGWNDVTDDEGNVTQEPFRYLRIDSKKAIVRPDTLDTLGIFGRDSYKVHPYQEWLLGNVASLLDTSSTDLGISSAGLLRRGGQAWVSIELPDDIAVEGAGHIRPCLIATTSMDGSSATKYAIRILRPECDNSLNSSMAASGQGNTLKIKHSSRSLGRIASARDVLGLIYQAAEEAEQWFNALSQVDVTDREFNLIVNQLVPVPQPEITNGKVTNQRSITIATNKQDKLNDLWRNDHRAAPWRGTLAGAFHAVNTFQQHELPQDDVLIRRQMTGAMSGTFDKAEAEFWQIVNGIETIHVPKLVVA